jgi:hypothetical protein
MRSSDSPRARLPAARQNPQNTERPSTSGSIASRIDDLERTTERVRGLYESYFLGLERRPPEQARQQLHRRLLETQATTIVNTALRFRFQTLMQRFTLLGAYWNRTMREIEAGTYRRDVLKAERHLAERGRTGRR